MALIACTTVGATKRGKSSPSKKEAMHSRQGGICPLCARPMVAGEKLIDEHMRALGLCGTNDADNRALVHAECAYEKTYGKDGDAERIAKAKAQKRAILGLDEPRQPMACGKDSDLKRTVGGRTIPRAAKPKPSSRPSKALPFKSLSASTCR